MPNALILGANGFVGPWLARELSSHGYRICASDVQDAASPRLRCDSYLPANLLDAASVSALLEATHPDQVYNLAAVSSVGQSWRNPALTMRVNVEGAVNLLEACRAMDPMPRVLLVGSSEEYAPSSEPLTENSPIVASNPYGISKEAQGRLADMYLREYGLPIYRVRAFNHTGPGQAPNFVLPSWCKQVAEIERSGHSGTINVGNLDVARDFSDVRDIVRAYRMLVESNNSGEVFNVGSGNARPLKEFLRDILDMSSESITYTVDPELMRPTDQRFIQADISKIVHELGWEPRMSLSRTLSDMYSSFLSESPEW